MLRFKKDLRPHASFSYRIRPSKLQRRIRLENALYPQCACSNELDACAFQYIGPRNWREIILVPRAYDPSGLRQESRALGATIMKEQRK